MAKAGETGVRSVAEDTPRLQGLLDRLAQRVLTIGILGRGYVGLPLALVAVKAGFSVI